MRFLSMIRVDEKSGKQPSEQLMTDMGKLLEEMTRTGALVLTAGLRPTSEGVRVRSRRGTLTTTDGPFTETKEVIGGFPCIAEIVHRMQGTRQSVEVRDRQVVGFAIEQLVGQDRETALVCCTQERVVALDASGEAVEL